MPVIYLQLTDALRIKGTLEMLIAVGSDARVLNQNDERSYVAFNAALTAELDWVKKIHKDYEERKHGIEQEKESVRKKGTAVNGILIHEGNVDLVQGADSEGSGVQRGEESRKFDPAD